MREPTLIAVASTVTLAMMFWRQVLGVAIALGALVFVVGLVVVVHTLQRTL